MTSLYLSRSCEKIVNLVGLNKGLLPRYSRCKKKIAIFFTVEIQIFWFTYLDSELEAHILPVSRPGGYYFHTKYELLTPTVSA